MKQYIQRRNSMFRIDRKQLSSEANKDRTVNALYGAIYIEYKGAATNPKYKDMTNLQKINSMNNFVLNWLSKRGLE